MEEERERDGCCGKASCQAQLRLEAVALRVREMLATNALLGKLLEADGAPEKGECAADSAQQQEQLPEQALHLQAVVLRLKARQNARTRSRPAGAKHLEKLGSLY